MADKFQKGGSKRCRKCGALNTSTMEVCGSCKTPFDGREEVATPLKGSSASNLAANREGDLIKRKLSSILVRIEDNWREFAESPGGRIAFARRRTFVMGFKTENEEVTITIPPDGHAFLGDDYLSTHNLDFEGPEKDLLALLEYGRDIPSIPDSISVKLGGRDSPPSIGFGIMSPITRQVLRDTAAKKWRSLLK